MIAAGDGLRLNGPADAAQLAVPAVGPTDDPTTSIPPCTAGTLLVLKCVDMQCVFMNPEAARCTSAGSAQVVH